MSLCLPQHAKQLMTTAAASIGSSPQQHQLSLKVSHLSGTAQAHQRSVELQSLHAQRLNDIASQPPLSKFCCVRR